MRLLSLIAIVALLAFVVTPATAQPKEDSFYVSVDYDMNLLAGGGSGYNNGMWYEYPSGWLNEWFYDDPYDPARYKTIHIEFDGYYLDDLQDTWLELAVNWSTPEWSALGNGDTLPPTPDFDENLYIGRYTLLESAWFLPGDHFVFDYVIPDYNPEWVSIDVFGWNFEVTNGIIIHECVPEPAAFGLLALGALALLRRR